MGKFNRYIVPLQAVSLVGAGYILAAYPEGVDFLNKHLPRDAQSPIGIYASMVTSGTSTAPSYVLNVASGPNNLKKLPDPNIGQKSRPEQTDIARGRRSEDEDVVCLIADDYYLT